MTLSATKLRAVVNMLSDPGSAANAASILAREAKERDCLVADLITQALAPTPASAPSPEPAAPPTAPSWQDVEPIDDGGPYVERLSADHIGLVGIMVAETPKAWCVEAPKGADAWLPKSQCENHGEDTYGRGIFIIPTWLAKRGGIA
jgi:hypothetical protein